MKRFDPRPLEAFRLLLLAPQSYADLADQLCICRGYAEQVVRQLRRQGLIIQSSRMPGRESVFWATAEQNGLAAVLSTAEQAAVQSIMRDPEPHLQAAIYKLTHLALSQHFRP